MKPIPVIDLFAGPGGLGEGFSAFSTSEVSHPFKIGLSIEKDKQAHETLRLRSFYRQFEPENTPKLYYEFLQREFSGDQFPVLLKGQSQSLSIAWENACKEAMNAELGSSEKTHFSISEKIKKAIGGKNKPWILIGGPPCQAYSLVGRARNRGNVGYRIEDDQRSTLYQEYLRIIAEQRPTVFVMENVKGMLSAKLGQEKVFEKILADLRFPVTSSPKKKRLGYRVIPVVANKNTNNGEEFKPEDFVVACEKYGVPQQRHRVILLGIRNDISEVDFHPIQTSPPSTVEQVIGDLPPLRSGISTLNISGKYERVVDDPDKWLSTIRSTTKQNGSRALSNWLKAVDPNVRKLIIATVQGLNIPAKDRGGDFLPIKSKRVKSRRLRRWYEDSRLKGVCNHETRGHMDLDLARYLFATTFAKTHGESPKLHQFPNDLLPKHKSAERDIFTDRFRVQLSDQPSSTITSHISKDGHYFIHPDPSQCRSLTVREAARLQTFPDNYYFCGPRTSQYVQVGNAVPPWIARQIAKSVWKVLIDSGAVK